LNTYELLLLSEYLVMARFK